jgi:hypothetical protein
MLLGLQRSFVKRIASSLKPRDFVGLSWIIIRLLNDIKFLNRNLFEFTEIMIHLQIGKRAN